MLGLCLVGILDAGEGTTKRRDDGAMMRVE